MTRICRPFKVILLILCLFISGCSTMSDVMIARENGESISEVYKINEEIAWEVAKKVVRQEGFGPIEELRKEHYFLTSSVWSVFEYGNLLGIWIEPISKAETRISVVSKRRVATNIITNLSEEGFHEEFFKELKFQVRQGRLPASVLTK